MAQLRSWNASRTTFKFAYYCRSAGSFCSGSRNGFLGGVTEYYYNNVNGNGVSCLKRSLHTSCAGANASKSAVLHWQNSLLSDVRCLHSAAQDKQAQVSVVDRTQHVQSKQEGVKPQRDPLDVSFNDPIAAFKSKTTWELTRAYLVYMICTSEKIVEHNMTVSGLNENLLYIFFLENSILFLFIFICSL